MQGKEQGMRREKHGFIRDE